MKTKAQKWGNSLAIRLPKALAEQAGVIENDTLDMEVTDAGMIVLKPHRRPKYRLKELLKDMTKKNMHEEIDLGKPVGREIW